MKLADVDWLINTFRIGPRLDYAAALDEYENLVPQPFATQYDLALISQMEQFSQFLRASLREMGQQVKDFAVANGLGPDSDVDDRWVEEFVKSRLRGLNSSIRIFIYMIPQPGPPTAQQLDREVQRIVREGGPPILPPAGSPGTIPGAPAHVPVPGSLKVIRSGLGPTGTNLDQSPSGRAGPLAVIWDPGPTNATNAPNPTKPFADGSTRADVAAVMAAAKNRGSGDEVALGLGGGGGVYAKLRGSGGGSGMSALAEGVQRFTPGKKPGGPGPAPDSGMGDPSVLSIKGPPKDPHVGPGGGVPGPGGKKNPKGPNPSDARSTTRGPVSPSPDKQTSPTDRGASSDAKAGARPDPAGASSASAATRVATPTDLGGGPSDTTVQPQVDLGAGSSETTVAAPTREVTITYANPVHNEQDKTYPEGAVSAPPPKADPPPPPSTPKDDRPDPNDDSGGGGNPRTRSGGDNPDPETSGGGGNPRASSDSRYRPYDDGGGSGGTGGPRAYDFYPDPESSGSGGPRGRAEMPNPEDGGNPGGPRGRTGASIASWNSTRSRML